jgi:hypothetical protein
MRMNNLPEVKRVFLLLDTIDDRIITRHTISDNRFPLLANYL